MAPLKVICASVGRSGTTTMRHALNILGYNVHDPDSLLECDLHPERFTEAYKHPEAPVDWNDLYKGFDAGADCPTFSFVERLSEFYPEAKVILVKRNPDDWYKSVLNTLCKLVSQLPENTGEGERRIVEMLSTIWLDGSLMDLQKFKGNPEIIKAKYQAHNNWVIQNVPADRLLVLDLRDGIGWEKLCAFLDKPVPAQPFPHKNSTEFFNAVRLPYLLKALESHRPAPIISPAK